MDERISERMLEKWFSNFAQSAPSKSSKIGKLEIEIGESTISIRNPEHNVVQVINPADFGLIGPGKEARMIVTELKAGMEHVAYILVPGSENVMALELAFEKDFFGVYPYKYPLGFPLSKEYCATALGKNLLICDLKRKEYVFLNERGERLHSSLEAVRGASCAVFNADVAAICTSEILYVIRGGQRVGIRLRNAIRKKIKRPVFGVGHSKDYSWLAVKDEGGTEVILVCLSDADLGYAVLKINELKGKEILD
ncbi:MAG: hypothetical protein QXH30_01330 [Candidatus Bilamarchaeaceae archaeon]